MPGDFDERMPQYRTIMQEMVLDGGLEGVQLKLDEIRSTRTAYLSATASATADLIYTVPNGKIVVVRDLTITNAAAGPALFDVFDGVAQIDAIYVGAVDSVVLQKSYRIATSLSITCSIWLTQTSYNVNFYEYPLSNRARTPPV